MIYRAEQLIQICVANRRVTTTTIDRGPQRLKISESFLEQILIFVKRRVSKCSVSDCFQQSAPGRLTRPLEYLSALHCLLWEESSSTQPLHTQPETAFVCGVFWVVGWFFSQWTFNLPVCVRKLLSTRRWPAPMCWGARITRIQTICSPWRRTRESWRGPAADAGFCTTSTSRLEDAPSTGRSSGWLCRKLAWDWWLAGVGHIWKR